MVPGLGPATASHCSPSHRWIATAVGISVPPSPPTAHASDGAMAATPSRVVAASPGFALRTTSQVGAQDGVVGEADGLVEGAA